jgi:Antibiotic biosynthesis monooxygenase
MILEHAILPVRPGSESDFEEAFRIARPLISQQPGFRSLSISRSIESPNHRAALIDRRGMLGRAEGNLERSRMTSWAARGRGALCERIGIVP